MDGSPYGNRQGSTLVSRVDQLTHTIHVWYIYLHEWLIFMVHVGKYTVHGYHGWYIYLFLLVHVGKYAIHGWYGLLETHHF